MPVEAAELILSLTFRVENAELEVARLRKEKDMEQKAKMKFADEALTLAAKQHNLEHEKALREALKPDCLDEIKNPKDKEIALTMYHVLQDQIDRLRNEGEETKGEVLCREMKISELEQRNWILRDALLKIRGWHQKKHSIPSPSTVFFTADKALIEQARNPLSPDTP